MRLNPADWARALAFLAANTFTTVVIYRAGHPAWACVYAVVVTELANWPGDKEGKG